MENPPNLSRFGWRAPIRTVFPYLKNLVSRAIRSERSGGFFLSVRGHFLEKYIGILTVRRNAPTEQLTILKKFDFVNQISAFRVLSECSSPSLGTDLAEEEDFFLSTSST